MTVVLQVSNADKSVAERLSCVLRLPTRKAVDEPNPAAPPIFIAQTNVPQLRWNSSSACPFDFRFYANLDLLYSVRDEKFCDILSTTRPWGQEKRQTNSEFLL